MRGHRLIQIGIALFLIGLLIGVAVPYFAVPRLALSGHLVLLMQGVFLSVVGLIWPRLTFTRATSTAAFWLLVYGCLAASSSNILGALWGAGNSILPIAAGAARGSDLQEMVIVGLLRSGGAAFIVGTALLLWGLRGPSESR